MRILAIDTALGACAAGVFSQTQEEPLAAESLLMERGHAEALMPLVERVVAATEGGFAALDRVAVSVGPGSYTGLRVGLSAARAIGLAAGVPVVGVSTLSALLAALLGDDDHGVLAAAIDARHRQVYIQAIAAGGRTIVPPALLGVHEALRLLGSGPATLIGSGGPLIASAAQEVGVEAIVQAAPAAPDIGWIARLGLVADPAQAPPKPLYLRGPDAQPQDAARVARR